MRLVRWIALAVVFIIGSRFLPAAERPNIVVIFADDLGINDLSCYGRKDQATPHLDRLATEGLRFTSAYCAQPICSPSRAAIMTGKAPARLHLTTFLPGRPDRPGQKLLHPKIQQFLPPDEVTIAERLHEAGYVTGCFGKWHLGNNAEQGPQAQGFDVVYANKANTKPTASEGGKGEYELTAKACDFIREQRDKPFFLFLPHNTPHIPLAAKPELIEKFKESFHPLYAAVIASMDECVGEVLATLAEQKLAEKTIVIFTSDNGGVHIPELGLPPPTHNTPYRAGKGYLYEGGLRVPFIVRWPGKIMPAVTDRPFINTDLPSTLLELVGQKAPADSDGVSQAASWLDNAEVQRPTDRKFFWHFPHYNNQGGRPAGAVRQGNWKYVRHYDTDVAELYDLSTDIGEAANLADQHPARVADMAADLATWKKAVGAQENAPNPQFNAAIYRELYQDVDTSRLPLETGPGGAVKIHDLLRSWRKRMDEKPGS